MISRPSSGWQTVLADLSLILFLSSFAALSQAGEGKNAAPGPSPRAEALSVYRAGADAPSLEQWLADQQSDPRQLLTIVSTYRDGEQESAMAAAWALAEQAGGVGRKARIVVEPGERNISATLAFDQPAEALAHALHEARQLQTETGTQQ